MSKLKDVYIDLIEAESRGLKVDWTRYKVIDELSANEPAQTQENGEKERSEEKANVGMGAAESSES